MGNKQKSVLVLFSGGIDSSACLKYYLDEGFNVTPVFIDYGQKAKTRELSSAKKISDYYNLKLREISVDTKIKYSSGEIKGRNAFFILITLMNYPDYKGIISLAIIYGTPYYDCSESFVKSLNDILNEYTNGEVQLDTPFLKWNKKMIIQYCTENDVPIHLTYSCEEGDKEPCNKCLSCLDRRILDVSKAT